ncbi:hypothetical protein PR048_023134 [Dryococelus australis]|uniref:Uncharacterized protein n=1 Tax=Dryococelus australis TaxID=614101 RepID=A0ABQ9GT80_9NEOP|nr:hypothetical protein PR048_023134 [Dryococelus australis]
MNVSVTIPNSLVQHQGLIYGIPLDLLTFEGQQHPDEIIIYKEIFKVTIGGITLDMSKNIVGLNRPDIRLVLNCMLWLNVPLLIHQFACIVLGSIWLVTELNVPFGNLNERINVLWHTITFCMQKSKIGYKFLFRQPSQHNHNPFLKLFLHPPS